MKKRDSLWSDDGWHKIASFVTFPLLIRAGFTAVNLNATSWWYFGKAFACAELQVSVIFIVSCVPSDGRNESFEDANTSITVISRRLCSRAVHLSHKRLNTSVMFESLVTSVLTPEVRLPRQDPDRLPDGPVGSAPARWPPPNVCISLSRTDRWSTCSWCPRNDRRNQTCQRKQTRS